MMVADRLKACPFCGALPEEFMVSFNSVRPDEWTIICSNPDCLVEVEVMDENREIAEALWNTRSHQ